MSYSFFGTCFNDHNQLFDCLKTIVNQSIIPKEFILVNSGDAYIEAEIIKIINSKRIKLVYVHRKLPRVESLNLALDKSTAKYSFRFDARSRFSKDYAKNALKVLRDKNLKNSVVGGVPLAISKSNKFESVVCAEIMNSYYLFFFPKHRNFKYSGYASSIYLGCFVTSILKDIRFNEKEALLSEDSLIINDFIGKGLKAYISSDIKLEYICRSSFFNLLRLFNTYGYCRVNTILVSNKLFISQRHFFVFLALGINFLILIQFSLKYLLFLPFLLLIFNFYSEISFQRKRINLFVPIYGTICQFSWILGFLWGLISSFRIKHTKSNFIS